MASQSLRLSTLLLLLSLGTVQAEPIVLPYLQNVQTSSAELYFVDDSPKPIKVRWLSFEGKSKATPAPELAYHEYERANFSDLKQHSQAYLHQVELSGFKAGQEVQYKVLYPSGVYQNSFLSLPKSNQRIRLIAYADSETEPESTGKPAEWGLPENKKRTYLVDQTTGYAAHLKLIEKRQPNAVLIAGDLVESGGEQRDWDEFWKHNQKIGARRPLLPSPGNHEYWAGPKTGGYSDEGGVWAINKYRRYFHPKGEAQARHYYAQEIGLATLISLDSGDGLPAGSPSDSNHYLNAAGNFAPNLNPGSTQYNWLESELKKAQRKGQFTIVMFHHCPYSSGTHGFPAGSGKGQNPQSGQAFRPLSPLFLKYGVDLILTGHDEMFERSEVRGEETLPSGSKRPHTLQVYDVGVGGDGLRGPKRENEFGKFLAYKNSPEVWKNGELVRGGRHYGHLEINIEPKAGGWKAKLVPVYLLPRSSRFGKVFERKVYPDVVYLNSKNLRAPLKGD